MSADQKAPMTPKAIGSLLRELRKEQKLTSYGLSKRAGLSQAQVSRLENGLQGFRSSTLVKIANALDCDAVVSFVPRGHR